MPSLGLFTLHKMKLFAAFMVEVAWKVCWVFSLTRLHIDSAVPVRFIHSSETAASMFPAAHTDYEDFTKILISLVT